MTNLTILPQINEFKKETHKIEQIVKQWESDFKIRRISQLSGDCYEGFVELQLALTKINDHASRKKLELDCYNSAYDFLAFVENEANEDLTVLLINNSKEFSSLIDAYSKYCTSIERKYKMLNPGHSSSVQ